MLKTLLRTFMAATLMAAIMFAVCVLLTAPAQSATSVAFTWGPSSGQVDGYRIYSGTTAGGPYPSLICDVNATALKYTAPMDEARDYYLVVRAYNQYGESGDSNEVHYFEQSTEPPGIPTGFIVLTGDGFVFLTPSDPAPADPAPDAFGSLTPHVPAPIPDPAPIATPDPAPANPFGSMLPSNPEPDKPDDPVKPNPFNFLGK